MDAGPHRATVPEQARFCPACDGPVGRGRGGRPGRDRGVCPWCRAAFDLSPALEPGAVVEGRRKRYRVRTPWRPGARGWLYLVDRGTGPQAHPLVLTRLEGPEGPAAGDLAVTEPETLIDLDIPGLVVACDVATAAEPGGPSRHLVLEHVPGRRPDAAGPLDAVSALDAVLGLCAPLGALHDRGLLHADVTPANVLVGGPDRVTLMDLGSLRRVTDRTSDVWGTTGFLAPEIVPGGPGPSVASEIYALGRTLAVLLLDFDHTRRYALSLPAPDTHPALAAPPALTTLLTTATAVEPDARHRDVAEFAAHARAVRTELARTGPARPGPERAVAGPRVHHDHGPPATPPHDRAVGPDGVGATTS